MNRMAQLLRIPERQVQTVLSLFAYSLLTSSSYMLTRTIGDSVLLARLGSRYLAPAFIVSAIAVILITVSVTRVSAPFQMRHVAQATRMVLSAVTVLLAVLLPHLHHSLLVVYGIYLLAEVRGVLNSIQLVSLLTETMPGTTVKKSVSVIAAGGPLAGVLCGTVLGIEAREFSLGTWLWVAAGIDLLAALLLFLTRVSVPASEIASNEQKSHQQPVENSEAVRGYGMSLAGVVGGMVFTLTFISYQWKVTAASVFANDETGLARFFAEYYGVTDLVTLIIQFLVAGRALDRIGCRRILLMYPLLLTVTGILLLQTQTMPQMLGVLTVAKGLDVFRRSFHDPALTVMYSQLGHHARRPLIATVNGVVKPVSEATAALTVGAAELFLTFGSTTWVWILSLFPWLIVASAAGTCFRALQTQRSLQTLKTQSAIADAPSPEDRHTAFDSSKSVCSDPDAECKNPNQEL